MHVLTQQMLLGGLEYDELLPLWAKRRRVILAPPPLFASIKSARTEKGGTWHVVETAKLVAGDNGLADLAWGAGSCLGWSPVCPDRECRCPQPMPVLGQLAVDVALAAEDHLCHSLGAFSPAVQVGRAEGVVRHPCPKRGGGGSADRGPPKQR